MPAGVSAATATPQHRNGGEEHSPGPNRPAPNPHSSSC